MKRFALLAVLVACGETTSNPIEQLNLDRPIDVTFGCYGVMRLANGSGPNDTTTTPMPTEACELRSVGIDPPGQEPIDGATPLGATWYGMILQSTTGTVALAQFPTHKIAPSEVTVIDADPLTPGTNSISVGEDPVAIVTDTSGCYAITANAGSCDTSVLDIASAVTQAPVVDRHPILNAAGQPVLAKPAALAMQPSREIIGNACPMQPKGIAYIAYPSCHLVAAIDTSTNRIVGGIRYDAAGVPTRLTDGNVTCPAECDDAGAITPGTRPVALDVEYDSQIDRAVLMIGADNSRSLALVELDPNTFMPLNVSQIALEDTTGKLGVTALAITPEIGMGAADPQLGMLDDATPDKFQFVYAVATDATVRVADILTVRRECDTQVDPRLIRSLSDINALSCFRVGDTNTPARRPGARGPGIELPSQGIPNSVDVFTVDNPGVDFGKLGAENLIGHFAVITATTGEAYVANIDDDAARDSFDQGRPFETEPVLILPHQLRDRIGTEGRGEVNDREGKTTGNQMPFRERMCKDENPTATSPSGPRSTTTPSRAFPAGTVAGEKAYELPSIRQVLCTGTNSDPDRPDPNIGVAEVAFNAPNDTRTVTFPDWRRTKFDETWTLTWEGSLSNDKADSSVDGPAIREAQVFVTPNTLRVVDQSRPFCDAGVEPYDIVQLRGCDPALGNAGCAVGYRCYVHPASQVQGLGACILEEEADRLANACKAFLTSLRRYTVSETKSGELQLRPRKFALRTTPTDGCVDDAQCQQLANYAAKNNSGADPVDDTTADDTHTWKCELDPDRKPLGGTGKRCLQRCLADTDCSLGRVCQGATPGVAGSGYCMEGVLPPQACINAAQRYELRGGEAFIVLGTQSGFIHPIVADTGGRCIRNPAAHPFDVGRIPLTPPACDPAADLLTGKKPNGQYDANPCSITIDQWEQGPQQVPNYLPGTCTPGEPVTTAQMRQAPALRFHNPAMTFHVVDPVYPGDANCILDRGGGLMNVPLVFPGFQLVFRQVMGFLPLRLGDVNELVAPAFPVKVLRGPTQSIWIMDAGDFLSTSTDPSTRGKVYRIESQSLSVVNRLR